MKKENDERFSNFHFNWKKCHIDHFIEILWLPAFMGILLLHCSSQKDIKPVNFTKTAQTFNPATTVQVALGDLDGDGDLDIFNAFFNKGSNSIWMNDMVE